MDEYLRLTPSPGGAVSERMQALLSQAVEEQVNEQRQVQSLLSEVRSALADVQRDSRVSPGGQADVRADLANYAHETRSQLALLDERLEGIVRAVGTSAQVLQGISGQLERVAEMLRDQAANAGRTEPVAQVRREVTDLRSRLDGVEAAVRGDVAGLQQRLAGDVASLQAASEETTRSIANHVDNAVLVLAEALLRRPGVSVPADAPAPDAAAAPPAPPPPAAEPPAPPAPPAEPTAGEGVQPPAGEPVAADEPVATPESAADQPTAAPRLAVAPEPAAAPTSVVKELPADDDEAGELVDGDRPGEPPEWGKRATAAYDDPLVDVPAAGEAAIPMIGTPPPYDLERALFGDKARPVVDDDNLGGFAPVPRTPEEVAADELSEGEADAGDQGAADAAGPDTGDSVGEAAGADDSGAEDEDGVTKRRPWWRPTS